MLCALASTVIVEPLRAEVVLMRNAGVFHGRVHHDGDRLYVELESGGVIGFPVDQVEKVCVSLNEAYRILRDRQPAGDPVTHLVLADWCLRNNLLAAVDFELDAARQSGADPTELERRMILLDQRRSQSAGRPNPASIGLPQLEPPGHGAGDVPVAAAEDAEVSDASDRDEHPLGLAAELNEDLRLRFVQEIQPRLVHGCAASRCHGPSGDTPFVLERLSRGQRLTSVMTERNLNHVLERIAFDEPESSLILQAASLGHGGLTQAVYPARTSAHFDVLERWVVDVSASFAGDTRQGGAPINQSAGASSTGGRTAGPLSGRPAAGDRPLAGRDLFPRHDPSVAPAGYYRFSPRDPFDPEIFNRYVSGRLGELLPSTARQGDSPARLDPREELIAPPDKPEDD